MRRPTIYERAAWMWFRAMNSDSCTLEAVLLALAIGAVLAIVINNFWKWTGGIF